MREGGWRDWAEEDSATEELASRELGGGGPVWPSGGWSGKPGRRQSAGIRAWKGTGRRKAVPSSPSADGRRRGSGLSRASTASFAPDETAGPDRLNRTLCASCRWTIRGMSRSSKGMKPVRTV